MDRKLLIACTIQHPAQRRKTGQLPALPLDQQSLYSWLPAATLESLGIQREKRITVLNDQYQPVQRSVGFVILRVGQDFTIDEVVFARRDDRVRLGTRTLQGLQLMADRQQGLLRAAPHYAATSPV